VHADNEVTLKMSLEISNVTGVQNIGGFNQPTIGQRRVEHEARLRDGEVNLIGGILQDTDTNSMSGYPWITKVPILKYFFGQETKERQQSEIVFAITPHIVRNAEIMDENLRILDIGTANSVTYRRDNSRSSPAANANPVSPAPAALSPSGNPATKVPSQQGSSPVQSPSGSGLHPISKSSVQPFAVDSAPLKPVPLPQVVPSKPAGLAKAALGVG
jgi:general secretion pathway protein D